MRPEERAARGFAAKALLDDPTIKEAFDEIEAEIIEQWRNSSSRWGAWFTHRKRERLWIELRTIMELRRKLAGYAAHAKLRDAA